MKTHNVAELEPYAVALEPEWMCDNILEPLMIQDDDEILLDEELSPEDIAEIARLEAEWQRQELAKGAKEAVQFRNDFKEELRARGVDIVDYCHELDIPLHSVEAERLAAAAGYHQTTWNDQHNVTRRAKEATRRVAGKGATGLAQAVTAAQEFTAANNAPAPEPTAATPAAQNEPDMALIATILPAVLERYGKGCNIVKKSALLELAKAKVNNRRPAHWVSQLSDAQKRDCDVRLAAAWREAIELAKRETERAQIAAERVADARRRLEAPLMRMQDYYFYLRSLPENAHERLQAALTGAWERLVYLTDKTIQDAATSPLTHDLSAWEVAAQRAADGAVSMARELLERNV